MFKTNLTMFFMVCAMLISVTFANAQTVIWGTGHSNVSIDSIGEFASVNGTITGAGWTSTAITANTDWVWSADGTSQGSIGSAAGVHINSPSLGNGVAMFDSDYFYDNNIVPQEGKLTSPAINLTGYADSSLAVKFYAGLRDYASDSNLVRFSIDGGATWISKDIISALSAAPNGAAVEGFVTMNIAPLLAGATNLTDCRIEFYFKGDSYFFSVDDVSIETFLPSFDLAVNEDQPSIVTVGSAELPLAFVNDAETNWGANVKNTGFLALPAANAKLLMSVDHDNGSSWVNVAKDTINLPAINVGESYFAFKSTIGANNWMPTDTGYYRVTYIVESLIAQDASSNDTLVTYFGITNNNYLSKVPLANDGYPFSDNATLPALDGTNLPVEHEFGSMYYIPAGVNGTYAITEVKYRGATAGTATGSTSSVITAKVYKFTDADASGWWTQAYSSSDPELVLLGLGVDTFALSSTTTYRTGEMTISDVDSFAVGVNLATDAFYFVSLLQSDPNGLRNANNQTRAAYIGYAETYYETTVDSMPSYYIPAAIFRDAHVDASNNIVGNLWYTGYQNNFAPVPSIGLVLENRTGVAVTPVAAAVQSMEMFPNPVSNQLTVKVSNNEVLSSVQYIVTDATGRVIIMHTNKNVQNDVMTFDVTALPAGVYFTTVRTNKGASTQKFVKK